MYKILSMSGYQVSNNIAKFVCDTVSDIQNLPTQNSGPIFERCSAGSVTICLEDRYLYMLSNAGVWTKCQNLSGVSNIITDDGTIEVASIDEIIEYV